MACGGRHIPVIDMQDFPRQWEKLIAASEDWGCFRIINHGVPPNFLSEMKSIARSFHDLPLETKQCIANATFDGGFITPTNINPFFEALGFNDMASPAFVDVFCAQLAASPQQRETVMKYFQATHELALGIGRKLVESMGLASDDDLFKGWPCQFWLNKYNFTPQTLGATGVRIHSDLGFLTILQDDEVVGGLEVMDKKSGAFIAVEPLPGALLVNFGDIAKAWSNGRIYNVPHRVQCKDGMTRFSITLFLLGPKEAAIEAPAELVDSEHPRLYAPFTFEDYRMLRLSTNLKSGEAVEHFRTTTTNP